MGKHTAELRWTRGDQAFLDNRYRRLHTVRFDGGVEIPMSSSPDVVAVPMSDPAAVDPEEAFVASLASCHMLWFLSLAARAGYTVDRYTDSADGVLARNAAGKLAMTVVTLRPHAVFSGTQVPTHEQLEALHHEAHEACFIASSVTTEVRCEPVPTSP